MIVFVGSSTMNTSWSITHNYTDAPPKDCNA